MVVMTGEWDDATLKISIIHFPCAVVHLVKTNVQYGAQIQKKHLTLAVPGFVTLASSRA